MTVAEAIQGLTTYPIPVNTITSVCISRGLDASIPFTIAIHNQPAYQLAKADVYVFLSVAPDLKEQEVSITNSDKKHYKALADEIYGKYEEGGSGVYGYKGDDFNA